MSDTEMRHPDSVLRLVSTAHRFGTPQITVANNDATPEVTTTTTKVSFGKSFQTVGQHPKTKAALLQADENRERLRSTLSSGPSTGGERVVNDSTAYLPLIHQILLSCKVQPEVARLDAPLEFTWTSGLETTTTAPTTTNNKKNKNNNHNDNLPKSYSSNAIMYDLVMTLASEGLGHATMAMEASNVQDYVSASREYKAAAGIFHTALAQSKLQEWTAKSVSGITTDEEALPVECSIPVAEALGQLFRANAQQMAIATVLNKPDYQSSSFGLLAKLSWGVAEELEKSFNHLRAKSFHLMSRMDTRIFDTIQFQIGFQKCLSMYFQARNQWDNKAEHGIAIALLKRSWKELQQVAKTAGGGGSGKGHKSSSSATIASMDDIIDFQKHIEKLLALYETENGTIYFSTIPNTAMALQKFEEGVLMGKADGEYNNATLDNVAPLPLILPPEPEVVAPKKGGGGGATSGMFARIAKIAGRR